MRKKNDYIICYILGDSLKDRHIFVTKEKYVFDNYSNKLISKN